MKIVLINASHRKNGATAKILNEFAEQIKSYGDADISLFHLSDLEINFCKGCCGCYKTGKCFLKDDCEMLSQKIAEADGLIIGTPNYVSNVSGQLKTFVDRGHFVIEQLLKGKYTVGVVTYENAEGGAAFKVLKKLFVFSGAKTTDKLIVKLPFNSGPSEKVKYAVKNKAKKMYKSILNKAPASLKNKIVHFFVFNFGIRPFVLKKGKSYDGVFMHWKNRGIV